jgi:exodeoxyribonuclease VII large subunit
VWPVGALCKAIAQALDARFNPIAVAGEITGYAQAASGHCYFSLKDDAGQIRCAMFRRVASGLNFVPRDGDRVELRGRLGVYEPRGELQLIVEAMRPAGQGALFEQFLRLKIQLEAEGLFAAERKQAIPVAPRRIGLVTSLGAAALHDVVTALQRRVPHIPVVLAPASVQGESAPRELVNALHELYRLAAPDTLEGEPPVEVILLVRGGGSIEDLWAFNDEALARTIAQSPVPVICGVGHETDFTIADFVADLRAPTPTAAAEMVAQPTQALLNFLELTQERLRTATARYVERQAQRVDWVAARVGRPSSCIAQQRLQLESLGLRTLQAFRTALRHQKERVARADLQLGLLDPKLVLKRGYAWLSTQEGLPVLSVQHIQTGQTLQATLTDGTVELAVQSRHPL